jgi:hypothetical protein
MTAAPALGISAAGSAATAILVIGRHPVAAGVTALVAAVFLLWGTVRARADRIRALIFAELMMDRVFDACLLAPIAWVWRFDPPRVAILALVGLGMSFVASYERARGWALGYAGTETVGYRAARAGLLVLTLLTGWIETGLWIFVALTTAAASARALNVARQERRSPRSFEAVP